MHEFSNVPNKAADFYKDQIEENSEKEPPKKEKGKENKDGKGKKNEVDKFLDEHTVLGPTETVVKIQ